MCSARGSGPWCTAARGTSAVDVAHAGLEAILAALCPGRTAQDVYKDWKTAIEAQLGRGYQRHHCGYSVGIGFLPSWMAGRVDSLRPGNSMTLRSGMTFHIQSWVVDPQIGTHAISDTALVTHHGSEPLTTTPRYPAPHGRTGLLGNRIPRRSGWDYAAPVLRYVPEAADGVYGTTRVRGCPGPGGPVRLSPAGAPRPAERHRHSLGAGSVEYAQLPGIPASRAAQSLAAAVAGHTVMKLTGIKTAAICPWAIREGVCCAASRTVVPGGRRWRSAVWMRCRSMERRCGMRLR
ncbi:M24 family metallopeptidase [Streptomyces chartreusis]|uniref:M24 family metallopeptidase n=1 Tax=Streptomyces chartreusis TaxID=1969 RepID=UPI0036CAB04E